jgi:hypothetical protein
MKFVAWPRLAVAITYGYSAMEISERIAKVRSCQLHACVPTVI